MSENQETQAETGVTSRLLFTIVAWGLLCILAPISLWLAAMGGVILGVVVRAEQKGTPDGR